MVVKKQFIADVEEVLLASFKKENILKELSKSIAECVYNKFHKEFDDLNQQLSEIKKEFEEFKKNASDNEVRYQQKINNLEQNTRSKNISVFGFKEQKGENTEMIVIDFFNSKLGTKITPSEIDRCHRVGKQVNGRSRLIIVKFTNYKQRMDVLSKKKSLKGTGVSIKEDLTYENLNKYTEASEKYGYKNTWTKNGRVIVKTSVRITNYSRNLDDEPEEMSV